MITRLKEKREALYSRIRDGGMVQRKIYRLGCFCYDVLLVVALIPFSLTKTPAESFQKVARFSAERGFVDSYAQHMTYYRAGVATSTLAVLVVALQIISAFFVGFLAATPMAVTAKGGGGGAGACTTPLNVEINNPSASSVAVTVGNSFTLGGHWHDSDGATVCAAVLNGAYQYNNAGSWTQLPTTCGAAAFCAGTGSFLTPENTTPTNHDQQFSTSVTARTAGSYTVRIVVGDASSAVTKTINATCPAVEAAPGLVSSSSTTPSSITWTWADNASSENGYRFEASDGSLVAGGIAANATSYTETGLSPNTQYTRHATALNCLNTQQQSDGSDGSAYTAIETPAGADFSAVTASSITVASSTSLSNLASASSGVYFAESGTGTNSGWITTNRWEKTGLTPNTQYSFMVNARNAAGDAVGTQGPFTQYTAAADAQVSLMPGLPGTWQTASNFSATNEAGWGSGGIQYYRYVVNQNPTYTFGGSESTWSNAHSGCPGGTCTTASTTLSFTVPSDGNNWYLHVAAYNRADVQSTSQVLGPYYVDGTAPGKPASINDGISTDKTWTLTKKMLKVNWSPTTDIASGIAKYQYAIGTTPGGTDIKDWTDGTTATAVGINNLGLADGVTYYTSVRAVDVAGNFSAITTSNGITVDAMSPTLIDNQADDAVPRASGGTAYNVDFSNGGIGSPLDYAQYAVGSTAGATDIKTWTNIFTADVATFTNDWQVDFASLHEGTNYISVRVADVAGNLKTTPSVFTLIKDTVTPAIANITATPATDSVTIAWTTAEASTSQVEWGTTNAYGNSTTLDTALVQSHSVTITGLDANAAYHYRVLSKDNAANLVASSDQEFSTNILDPTSITAVNILALSPTSIRITWNTNHAADEAVQYGPTNAYGTEVADDEFEKNHSIVLTNLAAATTYHYTVLSTGNTATASADAVFTTPEDVSFIAPPTSVEINDTIAGEDDTVTYNQIQVRKTETVKLMGTAEPFATIFIRIASPDTYTTTTVADEHGAWSIEVAVKDTPLEFGDHEVFAQAEKNGTTSEEVKVAEFHLTASEYHPAPTILTPADGEETINARPVITGLAHSGNTVHLYIDNQRVATLRATTHDSGVGSFGFTVPDELRLGTHTIHAVAEEGDLISRNSPDITFRVVQPYIGPTLLTLYRDNNTREGLLVVRGLALGGSRLDFFMNGEFFGRIGLLGTEEHIDHFTYRFPAEPLEPGSYVLTAIAYDASGKKSRFSNTLSFTKTSAVNAPLVVRGIARSEDGGGTTPETAVRGIYTVQSGDSLWSIGEKMLGDGNRYAEIVQLNGATYPSLLTSPSIVKIGWLLVLP